jgi:hypothetical protein
VKTVVYTVNANGWDNLRAPEVIEPGVRYDCFTNTPYQDPVHPWEFRPLYMPTGMPPARYARLPKLLPHLFFDADVSIYHDANFSLIHKPTDIIRDLMPNHDLALHAHPGRHCLYAEGECCIKGKIGNPVEIELQLIAYRNAVPENYGLWACGFMIRRHTPKIIEFNETWWDLFAAGCARDQISFPAAVKTAGPDLIRIRTLSSRIYGNEYVRFHWHSAWKTKDDNPNYEGQRARYAERFSALARIAGRDERSSFDA